MEQVQIQQKYSFGASPSNLAFRGTFMQSGNGISQLI